MKGEKLEEKVDLEQKIIKLFIVELSVLITPLSLQFHCPDSLSQQQSHDHSLVKTHYLPGVTLSLSTSITLICHFDWGVCSQSNAWLHSKGLQTANQPSELCMPPPLRLLSFQSVRTWTLMSSTHNNGVSFTHEQLLKNVHLLL